MFSYLPPLAGMFHVPPTEARRMRHSDLVRLTLSIDDEVSRQRKDAAERHLQQNMPGRR